MPHNIAEAVDPPQSVKKEVRSLNREQVQALLEAAEETKLYALYVLAVTTGMRQGELLGLKWEDLDLRAETLQVRRTVFEGKISAPKTQKSKRSIRLTSARPSSVLDTSVPTNSVKPPLSSGMGVSLPSLGGS